MDNLFKDYIVDSLQVPATKTETVTASAYDTLGCQGVMFLIHYGASGDTLSDTVYVSCKLTSCATEDGTYADVDDDDVLGSTTNEFGTINATGEDSAIYALCYNGTDRYVKPVATFEGTHTYGTPLSMTAIRKKPITTGETEVNP